MADDPLKELHAFTSLMDELVKVPKSAINEGVTEHRKRAEQNPLRRGPKPKAKASTPAAKRR